MHLRLIILFMLMFLSRMIFGQDQRPVMLYPEGIPNSKPVPANYYIEKTDKDWISQVSIPTLTPYFPDRKKANGTAVIICPGGGYAGLASGHEGRDVAKQFNSIGVAAFVLKYRLPSDKIMKDKTIGPLQDAQRAIQIVRQRAADWGIDPARIGIMGFSAGGHLASTAGTHFDKPVIANAASISIRPDFMILIYPVISFGPMAHSGSKEALIGKEASQQLADLYSNEKQVTFNTPPAFLVHAGDDTTVPVQNSLMMYEALLNAKVKAEMHIFQSGGHGFGLNNPTSKQLWFHWLTTWMDGNGWLK